MLAPNSILARLPGAIDPKQLVVLDGIRHAVEIADLAYSRLHDTLTEIALQPDPKVPAGNAERIAAFLDAWAFVDAADRF